MENEIDDDELAALLAEEDEQNNDNDNHPQETKQTNVSFAEQADSMTPEQLMQLTCSLIDVQPTTTTTTTTVKKDSTYKLSDKDIGDVFGGKSSTTVNNTPKITQATITPTV